MLFRSGKDSTVSSQRAMYESKVVQHLTNRAEVTPLVKKSEVTSLSLKLMQEKLERKYSSTLNPEQISLINMYVKASTRGEIKPLKEACESIKTRALKSLTQLRNEKNDKILQEKVDPVRKEIETLPNQNIQEGELSKYLTLIKLVTEVEDKENVK